MNIWIATNSEPLALDDSRVHRSTHLAKALAAMGHETLLWTSSFDHVTRSHRVDRDQLLESKCGTKIMMLKGPGYKSSVSVRRLWDHSVVGRRFLAVARRQCPPDLIVAALPTIDLCLAACRYGESHRIPVVIDIRDLWPDTFLDLFPRGLRPAVQIAGFPLRGMAARACRKATVILGHTDEFIDWGVRLAGRSRTGLDRMFPVGYPSTPPQPERLAAAEQQWRDLGVSVDRTMLTVCFFGLLNRQFDIPTVIEAARILSKQNGRARILICGGGENLPAYRHMAEGLESIRFLGPVNQASIWKLLRMSDAGLAPYKRTENFARNVPNKIGEYLSAGLPIVHCLDGCVERLVREAQCGIPYRYGDAADLAEQLSKLQRDRESLITMSATAKRTYELNFVAEDVYLHMAEHLVAIAQQYPAQTGRQTTSPVGHSR
jgi:glycosyltransferase involved in cell wall biosynthesis